MNAAHMRTTEPSGIETRAGPKRLAVVVATKDRPLEIVRLVDNLRMQIRQPERVIIVAAGQAAPSPTLASGCPFQLDIVDHHPPSAAAQRNHGIALAAEDCDLIALIDDDIVLEADAFERVERFYCSASAVGVLGVGLNLIDANQATRWRRLKCNPLIDRLGLYPSRPGGVALSGWQGIMGTVCVDTDVDWLSTQAAVWRAEILGDLGGFDERLTSYSYLEDLELSWRARQRGRLLVLASARYAHRACQIGKIDAFAFGRTEVRNRLYFVAKHGFSRWRCVVGLFIRGAMTAVAALMGHDRNAFERLRGNTAELLHQLRHFMR